MCRKHNEISPAILHVLHYYLKDQHHETGYDFNIFSLSKIMLKISLVFSPNAPIWKTGVKNTKFTSYVSMGNTNWLCEVRWDVTQFCLGTNGNSRSSLDFKKLWVITREKLASECYAENRENNGYFVVKTNVPREIAKFLLCCYGSALNKTIDK